MSIHNEISGEYNIADSAMIQTARFLQYEKTYEPLECFKQKICSLATHIVNVE